MNPAHHDDYLHTQLHGFQADETSPAHHLPFDRISPEEPTLSGELGEYMPQSDLAGTAADSGGDTPASDPAADGDDEDVHVAHAEDVEVYRAVADETQRRGDEGEEQATSAEVEQGDVTPRETHAYEGHAADVEVPRAVVNETHAHGVDLYEEPAGDAHVHDAAVSGWRADEAPASEAEVPEAVVDETSAHSARSSNEPGDAEERDAVASESHMHGEPAADVEVQLAVADERDVRFADSYQEPAGDAEVHDAVAGESHAHAEEPAGVDEHEPAASEMHAHGELAGDVEAPDATGSDMHAHSEPAPDDEVSEPAVNEVHVRAADAVDAHEDAPPADAEVSEMATSEAQVHAEPAAEVDGHEAASETLAHHAETTDPDGEHTERGEAGASGDPVADVEVHQAVVADADTRAEPAREEYAEDAMLAANTGEHGAQQSAGEGVMAAEAHVEPGSAAEVDGEVAAAGDHHAAAEQSNEDHLYEEPMHADHTAAHAHEGHTHDEHVHDQHAHDEHAHDQHTHDEHAQSEHQHAAGAEQHGESDGEEQAAVMMQAGPPDATMEESDVMAGAHTTHDTSHEDATGASESHGANGAAKAEKPVSVASAHPAVHPSVAEHISSAGDARGMLEGVAQSLRTLAGRDAHGEGIAIFPRGVDVLEVRMHISRDRDIDLNFRVAGPTVPGASV
jgi:hypothetical protein